MRLLPGMVMLMLALVIAGSARATTDVMPFKDEAQEQQFRQLTEQLRCPKCQNNSIADSNAMIATDMRRRVYDLMQEGKSRQEIIDYMVARYGNFVTYDPPLTPLTVLLWVLPLAAISYSQTGSYQQVRAWQQATAQTPGLLARALDPQAQPLNEEEMARLALGLRTRLQNDAGNVEGWLMLGRIGMVLGNAGTATGAYANACRLDPKNSDAALGYAEALTRSSDPEDNRRGGELLRRLVSRDHTDIRVLSLYAFSAFEQQRFDEAVAAWEMMLKLLPAGDARRAVIERSIRLAQEK
ncbi:cytochrome c-type biogenesis protein CcmH [Salmonella enterica]|uniref:Cytochrome c-type biogenesis protein CcmH n=1 Tax=Salmonella enterica TaxID=28901 RepID=A0A612TQ21_SALER|nr:cytochrome c-type biogenesis protein CcmH [Salmonella enterica]